MKYYLHVCLISILLISGCGYTAGSLIPSHIETIYVEPFKNETSEPNIEIVVTNAIKDRFAWDGALKIENSKNEADSMLQGKILKYEKVPVAWGSNDEVAEYRLVLTVNLVYTDLDNNKIMWQEKKFKVDSEYYTTLKDQKFTSTNLDRDALIENAAEELALEVVSRTVEGW
jgi:hypothetical protein